MLSSWSDGNVMWLLFSLTNLLILFVSLMSDVVASTLELIFETWKLISGILIFANQFSCPMALLNNDFSCLVSFCWGFETCSLFKGMMFILSVCVCVCLFPSTVEASPDWKKTINVMPEIRPMLCWGNYFVSSTFIATS